MAITLDDVVLEQMETNETLGMLHDQTILNFEMDNQFFGTLVTQFDEFIGLIKEQMRISREDARERAKLIPPPPTEVPGQDSPEPSGQIGIPIVTGLAAIAATAIGAIQGFIDINAKIFSKTAERIKAVGTTIRGWFTAFGERMKAFGQMIGRIFNFGDDAAKLGQMVKDFFAPVRNFFANIKANPIVKFAGTLGRILGRLIYPIMLAIDLFKGISGEFDQLAPDATLGDKVKAFAEGFVKGVQSFLFFPVELLKDVLSYLIGLIPGTEFITNFLDSFDIVDVVQGITDSIFDNLGGLVNAILNPIDTLTSGIKFITGKAIEFGKSLVGLFDNIDFAGSLRGMVKAILPPPDFASFEIPSFDAGPLGTLGGGSINLNPIPDSLYEWAAMDPPPKPQPPVETESTTPTQTPRMSRRQQRQQRQEEELRRTKEIATTMGIPSDNLQVQKVGGVPVSINGQAVPAEILTTKETERIQAAEQIKAAMSGDTTKTVPAENISSATQNNFTSEINSRSVENTTASVAPPVVIQDNSVNTNQQNNTSNQMMGRSPMSSPLYDNRTRASAYAAG